LARLFAQDERPAVALVPFRNAEEGLAAQFTEALYLSVENDGAYRPQTVDMDNLPADVPEGGFPPYVCPSPSMTGAAPYAMTGEMTLDSQTSLYRLRLYFWEMADTRLVSSDEVSVRDAEECAAFLPPLARWLFSRAEPAADLPEEAFFEMPEPEPEPAEYRLYAGLRAGSSLRFYSRIVSSPFVENDVSYFFNLTAGIQGAYYFFAGFGVQLDLLFTNDYAPFKSYELPPSPDGDLYTSNDPFSSVSLMIPLALKYTFRKGGHFASVLAGGYLTIPLGKMENESLGGSFAYTPPPGYTLGVSLGTKAGPGNLFLDLRWAADLGETRTNAGVLIYQRSMVSITAGYELGFIRKR
jgi:hypothetical protein